MRPHLFEFGDQRWFPASLRRAMTSYLAATYRITPFPKLWADRISKLLQKDGVNEIVDLGSGAGGPIALVIDELKSKGFETRVTLTDLYPNTQFRGSGDSFTRYWPEPVDAIRVPPALTGIRTMFALFHHFRPGAAHGILRDAFQGRRSICVFEATSRTPAAIATTLLIPLLVLVLTLRVRPLAWRQILFTYLVPILPLLIFWDGLVSQLRTYSVAELTELTKDLQAPEYEWEAGLIQASRILGGVPYLMGRPCLK
jgi:hypothetical protein